MHAFFKHRCVLKFMMDAWAIDVGDLFGWTPLSTSVQGQSMVGCCHINEAYNCWILCLVNATFMVETFQFHLVLLIGIIIVLCWSFGSGEDSCHESFRIMALELKWFFLFLFFWEAGLLNALQKRKP